MYGNELMNNDFGGIKVMTEPHKIFMNTINGNDRKVRVRKSAGLVQFRDEVGRNVMVITAGMTCLSPFFCPTLR